MIRAQATWAQVEVGSFILDKTDVMWKVIMRDDFHEAWTIRNKAGVEKVIHDMPPEKDVMMVVPTIEEAVDTFRRVIGISGIREERVDNEPLSL